MSERFPGYDVLRKWNTPSWNAKTRQVVAALLALAPEPRFFSSSELAVVDAVADRIVPQPDGRARIPVGRLVDEKLARCQEDGYRAAAMPREGAAWRRGIAALEAAAQAAFRAGFAELAGPERDTLLRQVAAGTAEGPAWDGLPPKVFWKQRLLTDILHAYWSHPVAWSECGWGGPASPRGYVRMGYDERDPWEAAETKADDLRATRKRNEHVGR